MKQENAYDEFEKVLVEYLDFTDDDLCERLWSSLANVNWYWMDYENSTFATVGYSFRAAGGMIAELRGEGDYMDWYCSGPYATVDPMIETVLYKHGWIADCMDRVCDEPKCLASAGCGTPTEDGYRWTCGKHYPDIATQEAR